jgi:hypothetical protein
MACPKLTLEKLAGVRVNREGTGAPEREKKSGRKREDKKKR